MLKKVLVVLCCVIIMGTVGCGVNIPTGKSSTRIKSSDLFENINQMAIQEYHHVE